LICEDGKHHCQQRLAGDVSDALLHQEKLARHEAITESEGDDYSEYKEYADAQAALLQAEMEKAAKEMVAEEADANVGSGSYEGGPESIHAEAANAPIAAGALMPDHAEAALNATRNAQEQHKEPTYFGIAAQKLIYVEIGLCGFMFAVCIMCCWQYNERAEKGAKTHEGIGPISHSHQIGETPAGGQPALGIGQEGGYTLSQKL
jgi:hypothetical protein